MTMDDRSEGPAQPTRIVLVVEDEVLVRMLACDILTDGGFHCIEAVGAQEAQALIDARPDIAVMSTDVDMPGEINGLGLAHLVAMRAPTVKILVTSGAASLNAGDLPAGARFVQKPYSPSTLLELLTEMTTST
jgi:two-component system, response regulator PdtaR